MQPRDLWLCAGDPFLVPAQRRAAELSRMLRLADPESPRPRRWHRDGPITRAVGLSSRLSGALMASFVRPNHPEVATIAREAADILARNTGDASFNATSEPPRGRVPIRPTTQSRPSSEHFSRATSSTPNPRRAGTTPT